MKMTISRKKAALNAIFLLVCVAVIAVLVRAPKETTAYLPHDEIHIKFYEIDSKKEAEQFCKKCHNVDGQAPLGKNHPPPYRCLFCHKRK